MADHPSVHRLDEDQRRWFREIAPVRFLPQGFAEVAGGPIAVAGWYVVPCCDPVCCPPHGPFASEAAARAWAKDPADRGHWRDDDP